LEARLEAKEAEMEAKIAKLTAPEPEAITDEDLVTLQARLEGLHASKLITDEVRRSDCRGLLLNLLVVHSICILLLAATLQWSRLLWHAIDSVRALFSDRLDSAPPGQLDAGAVHP
jgi:hypothetical protein